MRVHHAPRGTRLFARVDRFCVECPTCGYLLFANVDPTRPFMRAPDKVKQIRSSQPGSPYNPFSSRLVCPRCHVTYAVGLLLWPVLGGRSKAPKQPVDQMVKREQKRAWLRQREQAISVWPDTAKRAGDPLNMYIQDECCCLPGGWSPHCPIHQLDEADLGTEEPVPLPTGEDEEEAGDGEAEGDGEEEG